MHRWIAGDFSDDPIDQTRQIQIANLSSLSSWISSVFANSYAMLVTTRNVISAMREKQLVGKMSFTIVRKLCNEAAHFCFGSPTAVH